MSIIPHFSLTFFFSLFCTIRGTRGPPQLLGKVNPKTINKLSSSSSPRAWPNSSWSQELSLQLKWVTAFRRHRCGAGWGRPGGAPMPLWCWGGDPLQMLLLLAFSACKIRSSKKWNIGIIFKPRAVQRENCSANYLWSLTFFFFLPQYMLRRIAASISRAQR